MEHGENENLYFCFVNAEFYRVVWTINALFITIRSEMQTFSENNQSIKKKKIVTGQYCITMSFKIIARRYDGVFWWFPALSRSRSRKKNSWIHQNYLVALKSNLPLMVSFMQQGPDLIISSFYCIDTIFTVWACALPIWMSPHPQIIVICPPPPPNVWNPIPQPQTTTNTRTCRDPNLTDSCVCVSVPIVCGVLNVLTCWN